MSLETKSTQEGMPLALSIPDIARLTGLSEGLLYSKANEGSLPGCRRIGRRFLIHVKTFDDYLKSGMGAEQGDQPLG